MSRTGRRQGHFDTPGLLASERGQTFATAGVWTTYTDTGGGIWEAHTAAQVDWNPFGWINDSGASRSARAYNRTCAVSSPTGYTASHTVHLRIYAAGNSAAHLAIGPATAVHTGGGGNPGNCYFVRARFSGGSRTIELCKCRAGTVSVLHSAAANVDAGDVLSIGYRWSTASAWAELTGYLNGVQTLVAIDNGLPFDYATLGAKPGMWGDGLPSLALSLSLGHWSNEWWVTDLIGSYAELRPTYPAHVGELGVSLKTWQRYTDSPASIVKHYFAGEIVEARWSFRRNGGCNTATVKLRPQDPNATDENPAAKHFEDPSSADWNANDWHGGALIIGVHYDARKLETDIDHTLWHGRIRQIDVDRTSRVVTIEADGLVFSLDQVFCFNDFTDVKLRDVISELVARAQKGATPTGKDYWITGQSILGRLSMLDYPITATYRFESVRSALDSLLKLLPEGFVWGVDQHGTFYVQPQVESYDENMTGIGMASYDVADAREWRRSVDLSGVVNQVTVIGDEDPAKSEASGTFVGYASAERSRALWGQRHQLVQDSNASDHGIAAKIAQATCKRASGPRITARLRVVEPMLGQRSFWQSLVSFAPSVAIRDRSGRTDTAVFPAGFIYTENVMRRFGDAPSYSLDDDGGAGAVVTLASNAAERALNVSWLLHVVLKFHTAHPGGNNTWAYILGRPSATAARMGWGGLYWQKIDAANGNLQWWYEDTGSVQRTINLGINVVPATPGNQVVHLTLARTAVGGFIAYDGTTLTATTGAQDPKVTTADWRWLRPAYLGGGADLGWKGALDQFWLIDMAVARGILSQPGTQPNVFIARNNNVNLHRNEGAGLLMHVKFNDHSSDASTQGYTVWRPGGYASAAYTLAAAGATGKITGGSTAQGFIFGQAKRWGGPLLLNSDSVTYRVSPGEGIVEKDYELGEPAPGFVTTLARLQEEARVQKELLRRVASANL